MAFYQKYDFPMDYLGTITGPSSFYTVELSQIFNDPSYFEKAKKLKEDLLLENQLEKQDEKIKEAIDLALFNNRHRQP